MTPAGFPHSDIPGSKPVCGSPRLIAAYHVLHRLSAPRHPPCTLSSLTKLRNLSVHFLANPIASYPIQLSKSRDNLPSADCRGLASRNPPTPSPGALQRALANRQASVALANLEAKYLKNLVSNNPLPGPTRLSSGGADRVRTDDLRLAKAALSQLSYSPSPASEADAHSAGGPR